MVRLEIKDFITEYGDTAARLPYAAAEDTVIFADVRVTGAMADKRYAYLSLDGVAGEAEVLFRGCSLGKISSGERAVYDVKALLSPGDAKINIRLKAGAVLTGAPVLISFNSAAIDSVHVTERHEGGRVTLDLKLRALGNLEGVKAIATLVSPAGQIYYGGITKGYGSITVKDPLYWWPRGLGVQNLYKLTVNLYGESDVEDTKELFVGLRTASVLRDGGAELTFNGLRFIPMGAHYTPPVSGGAGTALRQELLSLAEGGANAVFIDPSVEYIPHELLELCDREGIVIIKGTRDTGSQLELLSSHASVAFLAVADGEDSLYSIARGAAPDAALIFENECGGAIIESPPSLPRKKTLRALGDNREINPLSAKILSIGGEAYRDVLVRAADEYLLPSGGEELGYLTRHLQAKAVKERIAAARLGEKEGTLSFAVYSELSSAECGPSVSAIDGLGQKKLVFYSASRAFSQVFAGARRTDVGVDITVSNYRRSELSGRLYCRVNDASNNTLYEYTEEIAVSPLSSATVGVSLEEYISDREKSCYIEYGVIASDARYSDTMLFVKPKDFLFEKPTVSVKAEGAGCDFSVTLSSDKYTAGVEICSGEADVLLSDNGFDITSSAPIKVSAKLSGGKMSAEELASILKVRCLNTIGIDN